MKKSKAPRLADDRLTGDTDRSYNNRQMRKGMHKKGRGFDKNYSAKGSSRVEHDKTMKASKSFKDQDMSAPLTLRKQVDPETVKYFSEIANVLEAGGTDLEERSIVCGNALEETNGKELELSTDYIISHTLQTLLEGCDVNHLCGFLRRCAKDFPFIAMDRSGSHVAETALKSLAVHLQDKEVHSLIEETLTTICKVLIVNPIDVICNCYGSHVLRSLLCLCKGVPLDSAEIHSSKSSSILAARFNLKPPQVDGMDMHLQHEFPDLLKFLVLEMLKHARKDIRKLQVNQYSSLVLQTALKLFVGYDEELLDMIPVVLGCRTKNLADDSFVNIDVLQDIRDLMKETSFSHLMEVILEVAPESLYNEIFMKIFRNSLLQISSHSCGNFVVQALFSHANCQAQIEVIWDELGTKFKDLLGMGRSGVIASLIAASQRLHVHEHKCCQALAAAVCLENESSRCIVPRILFLDNYFCCEDPSSWDWPNGAKIHIMGSLILQSIFKFSSEFIHPYITSITSLEADQVLEAAKDAGGARVIETFLGSNALDKQKRKLIFRLRGHFGELSMHPSGSFTVEKCFIAGNMSSREIIVSELLAVRTDLSRTKQGPHLLRALDVERFASRPDEWRSRQASKQSVFRKFYAAFATNENKIYKKDNSARTSQQEALKQMRKEIDHCLASAAPHVSTQSVGPAVSQTKLGASGLKPQNKRAEGSRKRLAKHAADGAIMKSKGKKESKRYNEWSENMGVARNSAGTVKRKSTSQTADKVEKKRRRKGS